MGIFRVVIGCVAALWLGLAAADASPWAEVGDSQLRSDIQILAQAGIIDDITTQWPIPWAGVLGRLRGQITLAAEPPFVQEAARRVMAYAKSQMHRNTFAGNVTWDFTNDVGVVRGFDGMGRNKGENQASIEYMNEDTALRISVGAWTWRVAHNVAVDHLR